ncbi:DUF5457 domain-containing protein [Flagellimonas marinaquae]|uniref:DUF5457 domain-containing protein n=1 Tax=Flagellimonas marinaquae TaxID=254955 RepID=UPI0020753EFD|nr:DUF5457 domain-containing protein [Allomuricauda aquimarina]USD26864.1 DUF5457 domain-containing protein [Allomuricauda aquimarina]
MSIKKVTGVPLHEIVLKIMYLENVQKAAEMAPKDVLWRINNPEISERQIREVLDWLVMHNKVNLYLGKYSLDRIAFLEQMELYEDSLKYEDTKMKTTNRENNPKMYYVTSLKPRKDTLFTSIFKPFILILGLLVIAYSTYTYWQIQHPAKMLLEENVEIAWEAKTIGNQKNLYISNSEDYDDKARSAISSSFFRQNAINKIIANEVNHLNIALDSITKTHHEKLTDLQIHLQQVNDDANILINNLAVCNSIIIFLFVLLYLEKL